MTAAERRAAQDALKAEVGALTRQLTDKLNEALTTDLFPDGLPQNMRRVLSTAQIAAVEYAPAA